MRLFAGQSAWVLQRLTALMLLVLLIFALLAILLRPPGFEAWHALVASAHGAVLITIGFLALALHGWVGARDIVLDYVHQAALRLVVLALVAILLTGVFIRVLLTLAKVFGGGI
jgi:succinate dehydrogenase / fumarate reductase, membrane anchor subunit